MATLALARTRFTVRCCHLLTKTFGIVATKIYDIKALPSYDDLNFQVFLKEPLEEKYGKQFVLKLNKRSNAAQDPALQSKLDLEDSAMEIFQSGIPLQGWSRGSGGGLCRSLVWSGILRSPVNVRGWCCVGEAI